MDFLPKQMCHRCSYKLEEFYNFYVNCVKTDSELKSQLSWMRKETAEEQIITPMVKMNPFKIKTEPPDSDDANSSDVFGHISSFGAHASPILTCSRCRCVCNTNIKVSTSPKEKKPSSKEKIENQPHSSNIVLDLLKKDALDNSKNCTVKINLCESGISKEVNVKEKESSILVIDNNDFTLSEDVHNDNSTQFETLNRSLRPRKESVDYNPIRKKGSSKLKEKFKNKVDIFDSNLVDPVKITMTSNNLFHPSPILKLEKVDAMKNMRARKNLEEFNKRMKELQQTKRLHREGDPNNKFLRRLENRSRKSFLKEENQNKKRIQKEENLKRKSLQIERSPNRKIFLCDKNEKSLEMDERQGLLSAGENHTQKDFQKEEDHNTKSLQREENVCNEVLLDYPTDSSLKNGPNANVSRVTELQIKQEVVKAIENNDLVEDQLQEQEKVCKIDMLKNQKALNSLNRSPMYPIVKLEKDYTCNVDYPRVKIKRHLTVSDSSKLLNGVLEVPGEQKSIFGDEVEKKSSTKSDVFPPKSLRRKEKRLKVIHKRGNSGKVSKKRHKPLDLVTVKKVISVKSSSVPPQTEFKYFCEGCDMCFRNKELYKLHPCYQK